MQDLRADGGQSPVDLDVTAPDSHPTAGGFDAYMRAAARTGRLVVQPRMGFSRVAAMREGLRSVKAALGAAPRIGTVTIDAYTRVNQVDRATAALHQDRDLNGFPIVSHGPQVTTRMLDRLRDASFPVQVRHGSAFPLHVFQAAAAAGFDAIEGGPVSYNLPYSRAALGDTVIAWEEATRFWADRGQHTGYAAHLETFAGCMFGQLCPPSLLVALSVLEGLFFVEHGIESLSLSLAQGTNDAQDVGALLALSYLAAAYFPRASWHIVYYTFMGLFPQTSTGAEAIIRDSARIAVQGGAHRLIVKTVAESRGIPTIAQNVDALRLAREAADSTDGLPDGDAARWSLVVMEEAERLIAATLALDRKVGKAFVRAFANGTLDVPYCPHPANRNAARTAVDPDTGALVWASPGAMPLGLSRAATAPLTSRQFHAMLDLNRRRYDVPASGEAGHA